MTTNLNPQKIDFLENINLAIEILQTEADNTQMYTRMVEMMTEGDLPRSAAIGHKRRQRVLAAIEELKLLRLQSVRQNA